MPDDTIWLLNWELYDRSDCGTVNAYVNEEDAKRDLALLKQHADKHFYLKSVPLREV